MPNMQSLIIAAAILVLGDLATATPATCKSGTRAALTVDFNNWGAGTSYTHARMKADFKTTKTNGEFSNAKIVKGDSGSALEVTYPAGCYGTGCGLWLQAPLPKSTEAYVSYRVKFDAGFTFMKGGKLPGACGGTCTTGKRVSTGYNGFSDRIMWRDGGRLMSYVYHPHQKQPHGDDFHWNVSIAPGQWATLTQRIVMNSVGSRNGILEVFFNGKKLFTRTDFEWRKTASLMIDAFQFVTFFGGDDSSWAPSKTVRATFDDFQVCVK